MSEGQKRAATKRKRSKKQGVGGKPTVVKAMKKNKVAVRKMQKFAGQMEQCYTCGNVFPNYRMLSQHQQQQGH